LIGKKNPYKRDISSLRMVQWAFRVICKICGVKTTVIGHENVPKDEAVLYVANHNSYFDIMISYALCPGLTGYIAKDSIEKVPLLNTWMRRLYCLFMNRDDMKQSLKVILQGIEYIKQGISICIFPEGSRGDSEEMAPFKEGSLKMAEKTGCAIIPIAISNTRNIIYSHMPFVTPTHVVLEYGKPIYPKELTKDERRALGRYTQDIIQDMLEKNKALIS
jgi:1-acyl-sn-glycerol-3-phosphate acyltransferase